MKTYIIVGDNNFWYSTFKDTKAGALDALERVRLQIEAGTGAEFDEPSEASRLYLYEAKEIEVADIENSKEVCD